MIRQVSQTRAVQVIRIIVKNSHYVYRENRQMEKSILNLATQSYLRDVQDFLVDLLNEGNKEVQRAHASTTLVSLQIELVQPLSDLNTETPTSPEPRTPILTTPVGPRRRTIPDRYGEYKSQTSESGEMSDRGESDDKDFQVDGEQEQSENFQLDTDILSDPSNNEYDMGDKDFTGYNNSPVDNDSLVDNKSAEIVRGEYVKMLARDQEAFDQDL